MLTIKFSTDNAAFDHDCDQEVARVLRQIASEIEHMLPVDRGQKLDVFDINGNTIGWYKLEK